MVYFSNKFVQWKPSLSKIHCRNHSLSKTHSTDNIYVKQMPTQPDSTWMGYLQHSKFWRSEVKRSLVESVSNVELVKKCDGKMAVVGLVAIAPFISADILQMVMQAELPDTNLDDELEQDETKQRPILELQPLISLKSETEQSSDAIPHKITSELALHYYERMRGQLVDDFKLHEKSGAVLFTTAKEISVFKNNEIKNIAQWRTSSTVLNVSFCNSHPNFVAFICSGQLFIDRENSPAFRSDASLPNITNGIASFAVQRAFGRYDGYFWSPTLPEIVYERVDESPVCKLPFTLPSIRPEGKDGTMRYPLAGTNNAIVTLRCCRLNLQNKQQFDDFALDVDLRSVVPWMEYIVDLGWTSDGSDVFASVMDRIQTQIAVLLIPRGLFVSETQLGKGIGTIRTIYMESSEIWVNANKHLHFLPSSNTETFQNSGEYTFIIGSERNDLCHLYLHDTRNSDPIAITSSTDWPLLTNVFSKVDTERKLIFFLANRISPILISLCVSNYSRPDVGCRVLTPSDMSYGSLSIERSSASLYLNPDIGFVCWVSSVQTLPECRLYRFIHSPTDPLPRAVFTHRIGVKVLSLIFGPLSTSWGMPSLFRPPSDIVKPIFFEYISANSGKTHHGLLLLPAHRNGSEKFPVIHEVYAGPKIQLVRNSWYSVCDHLKFVAFGYAVLMVDGRGSANRGIQFASAIKHRMGSAEIDDQQEGMRVAEERFGDLLDVNKVAVIGWSYGGYASLLLLACFPSTYRCACVGGAVSDCHLCDTSYTERYMGMPEENAEAYEKSALSSFVPRLPNQEGRLMIVHGMIDENVHFSHCSKLISALISAQKPYQLLLFPEERHDIRSGAAVEVFHANVLSFFARAFSSPSTSLQPETSSTAS